MYLPASWVMPIPMGMNTTIPPQMLDFGLLTIWMALFLLSPMDTTDIISEKNYLKWGLVKPQHTFPIWVQER